MCFGGRPPQRICIAFTSFISFGNRSQGPVQHRCRSTLFRRQIDVTAAHRQTIGFANRWHNHDRNRYVEIRYHLAYHHGLLSIFLPKIALRRLDNVEQLTNNCCYLRVRLLVQGYGYGVDGCRRRYDLLLRVQHGVTQHLCEWNCPVTGQSVYEC